MAEWNASLFIEAIRFYSEHSLREAGRVKRNLFGLSEDDQAELVWKAEDQVQKINEAVQVNLAFVQKLAHLISSSPAPGGGSQSMEVPVGWKPVQVLLQTFVRDWGAEGQRERGECFDLLLGALDEHLGKRPSGAGRARVMLPSAGLCRLAFEIQKRGHECVACEARVLHYFGSELLRQQGAQAEAHLLQPFALSTCNRFKREDHIRKVHVPEVAIEEGSFPELRFGELQDLCDAPEERAAYDAVVTSFAVDLSPNIFRFVRTVAHCVKPGGLWTNFGPLAYETDHDEGHGPGIMLSWEELRHAASHFFVFDAGSEKFVESLNASNGESMMQTQYSCIFFRAVRNDRPAAGIGGTK